MAKELGQINASSQADIAFLLLVFFLVTTSMSVDQGLNRTLPPPADKNADAEKINERNIFIVLINKDNQLAIEGELSDVRMLTDKTIEFLTNPNDNENLAAKEKASEKFEKLQKDANAKEEDLKNYKYLIDHCGDPEITKGVVSLQNDRGTKYETYIAVQNAIVAAFDICRDNFSKENFGKTFDELSSDQQKIVKLAIPLSISEAEPRSIK